MARSFELLSPLGSGAFGEVHLARVRDAHDFEQIIAIKRLHPGISDQDERATRLRDEARLLALLRHEHIVAVHGLTRIEGRLALLMEVVEGVDLSRAVGEPVPPRATLRIITAVAEALHAAYAVVPRGRSEALRVVHRDLKPSNLMVTARGQLKVLDFGVASARFDTREAHTHGASFGTGRFMSPERWLQGLADAPCDIYALGWTALELLRGQAVAQPRLEPAAYEADLHDATASLSPDLAKFLCELLSFHPDQRPLAAEVAQRARLLVQSASGPDLPEWAADFVPRKAAPRAQSDATATVREDRTPLVVTRPVDPRALSLPSGPQAWLPLVAAGLGMTLVSFLVWPAIRPLIKAPQAQQLAAQRDLLPAASAKPAPTASPIAEPRSEPSDAPPSDAPPSDAPPSDAPLALDPTEASSATLPIRPPAPIAPKRARPEPVVAPVPASVAPPTVPITIVLDPPTLKVQTPIGGLAPVARQAIRLPADQTARLSINAGTESWSCVIPVGGTPASWRVDGASQRCLRVP